MTERQDPAKTYLARVAPEISLRPSRRADLWNIAKRQPGGAVAVFMLVIIVICGIVPDLVASREPNAQIIRDSLRPPMTIGRDNALYLLGTDILGRDVFSRVVNGARISLGVGVSAVLIGTIGGLLLGMISAAQGGRLDMVLQRVMDAMQAIPTLVLAMMLVAVLGTNLFVTSLAIGVTQIPRANRIIRSNALSIIQESYIDAAKAMGASKARVLFQHIMPNVMPTTLIVFSTSIGGAIVVEATLSYLGLAAPPPLATWGNMLAGQARLYMVAAPWLVIAPAVALSITVLAFNFLGDALRDLLDPRLRGR